jgi:hypothetical protein
MFTATLPEVEGNTVRAMVAFWTSVPDFPAMVTEERPALAEPVTVNVTRQLAGDVPLLNDPTTPAGSPVKLSVTMLENPFWGVKVSVVVPVEPCATLSDAGEADKVNVGGLVMVSAIVVLAVRVPDVPVIVTDALDTGAVPEAVKVTALVRFAVTGPNEAVTPAGSPAAMSATAPLKPF